MLLYSSISFGQSYTEYCSSVPEGPILDVLYQNGNTYYIEATYRSFSVNVISSDGEYSELFTNGYRSALFGKFFETDENSWDLVLAGIYETDFLYDEILVLSKDSLENVSELVFNNRDDLSNNYLGTIYNIDRYIESYGILGSRGFTKLDSEASFTHDSLTYVIRDAERKGMASRQSIDFWGHEIAYGYTWDAYSLFHFNSQDTIHTFTARVSDIAFDKNFNYVLLEDSIIKFDTLMQSILETHQLPSWLGTAKKIKVDDDFFFVVHSKNIDRVVRYSKNDPSLYGFLYEETDENYEIQSIRLRDESVITNTRMSCYPTSNIIHHQDKKLVLDLDKRPQLDLEILESEFLYTSGAVGNLSGTFSYSIYNSGKQAISTTAVYSTGRNYFKTSNYRYEKKIDQIIEPGETVVISDYMSLTTSNDKVEFYISAADGQPLQYCSVAIPPEPSLSSDLVKNSVHLYPNPLSAESGLLYFDFPLEVTSLVISDSFGKAVFSKKLTGKKGSLDLSGLNPGSYVVSCIIGAEVYSTLIVVQ